MGVLMRRRMAGVVPGLLVLAASVAPAAADEPVAAGWWTASLGPLALPAEDVPEDGLLVQGGASSPTAIAALIYEVPDGGSPDTLDLAVAPNTLTTPAVTLQLCPLTTGDFEPVQGGPISEAPDYDCAAPVTAAPSSDGATYSFAVDGLVVDGVLAVAILPASPVDRVVFDAPGADALVDFGVAPPPPAPPTTEVPPVTDAPSFPVTAPTGGFASPPLDLPVAPTPNIDAAPSAPVATSSPQLPVSPLGEDANPLAVGLLALGAVGGSTLWARAGRERPDGDGDLAGVIAPS